MDAPKRLPRAKAINYEPIIRRLMVGRDKEGAIEMIKKAVPANDLNRVGQAMKTLRTKLSRCPEYEDLYFRNKLLKLSLDPEWIPEDRAKLEALLTLPAHKTRFAQTRSGYFKSLELKKRLSEIRIFDPMYYEFLPDGEIAEAMAQHRRNRAATSHQHGMQDQEKYQYTETEIDSMIQWAHDFCLREDLDWTVRKNSLNMLEALCILTGRRKWELCNTLRMRSSPDSDYQAIVWGICKVTSGDDPERPIPLLAPIDVITKGINKLRRYPHTYGSYKQGRISRKFSKMGHTFFRDVYTQRAYRDRFINKFHPHPCSKLWWCSQALSETLSVYCEHYATTVINEPNPGNKLDIQVGPSELAYSPGGSPEYVFQDPL